MSPRASGRAGGGPRGRRALGREPARRVGTELSTFPERPITVVLHAQEQFRDITRSPDWAVAAYDGRIRLPVRGVRADSRELERVLTHEFPSLRRTCEPMTAHAIPPVDLLG